MLYFYEFLGLVIDRRITLVQHKETSIIPEKITIFQLKYLGDLTGFRKL